MHDRRRGVAHGDPGDPAASIAVDRHQAHPNQAIERKQRAVPRSVDNRGPDDGDRHFATRREHCPLARELGTAVGGHRMGLCLLRVLKSAVRTRSLGSQARHVNKAADTGPPGGVHQAFRAPLVYGLEFLFPSSAGQSGGMDHGVYAGQGGLERCRMAHITVSPFVAEPFDKPEPACLANEKARFDARRKEGVGYMRAEETVRAG